MALTKRILILLVAATVSACANKEYRVERIDGAQTVPLPFKFAFMAGMRDGDMVLAAPVFKDGKDGLRLDLRLRLGPPITFVAGTYHGMIGDRAIEGPVVSDALSFLGGQNALPSVGGVFRLQDSSTGRTVFRVTMPPTAITNQE
jgi:hypothetical protein